MTNGYKSIHKAFCMVIEQWNFFPKHLKNSYRMFKYNHLNNIQPVGIGKQIEIIEAAGYIIEIKKDGETKYLTSELEVLQRIIYDYQLYKDSFQIKFKKDISMLIKDISDQRVTSYKRKLIISQAGYSQAFVKL